MVIENRVRNDTEAMFIYYRYDGDRSAGGISTRRRSATRRKIVSIGITIKVGERPDLAAKDVVLSTEVQIRQRYEGGLK